MKLKKISVLCIFIVLCINFLFIGNVFADETALNVDSPSAILIDSATGKILYEKNSYERRYPASLTKVMTAIVVLEHCNLEDKATVSYDSIMSLSYGYVTANLQVDEELSVENLLYVMMVGSANDSAIVLAEHVSGSVENFSILMNEKAKEIGCLDTNFVNPNGVHDENHYSTAYDMALIANYAMKNETFRKLVTTTYYALPATNKYENTDRVFSTTNELLIQNSNNRADNYYYKYATGVKTGFTTPAGNCLIASATKDNLNLISVVLGAGLTADGFSQRYSDTITLLDYGYDNYNLKKTYSKGNIVQTIKVKHATKATKQLEVAVQNDIYVLLRTNSDSSPLPTITINENLKAPIHENDIVGNITYNIDGILYKENLIASKEVKATKFWLEFFICLFILLMFWCFLRLKKIRKKNRRLKNKKKSLKRY